MKDKRVNCRLSEEDYLRLMEVSKPLGGVSEWISQMLVHTSVQTKPPNSPVVHTKKEILRRLDISHSPNCSCFICKPPKGDLYA